MLKHLSGIGWGRSPRLEQPAWDSLCSYGWHAWKEKCGGHHHTGQDRRRRETSRQGEQHQIGTRTFYRPFTSNGTDAFRPALRLPFRLPNHKSAGFDAILYSSLKRVVATSDRASHALAKIAPSRFTSSSHSRYSIHIIIPLLHSSGGPISPCYRSQKSHANRIVRPK